jgi:hypothetical protein
MAGKMLENNKHNRPITQSHVDRIADRIRAGKWRFNGDTIKISEDGDVLDGQHRLCAIFLAGIAVETIVVYGIARDAFATIDTIRRMRSLGDTMALNHIPRYRNIVGSALAWLIRYQRGIEQYRNPALRVENTDVEDALGEHPGMVQSVEKAMGTRGVANPSLLAFLHYLTVRKNEAVAERFIDTLIDPAGVSVNDPFFRLRHYFTSEHHKRKDPLVTIALSIKALNAAAAGDKITVLAWKQQGKAPESFPKLKV